MAAGSGPLVNTAHHLGRQLLSPSSLPPPWVLLRQDWKERVDMKRASETCGDSKKISNTDVTKIPGAEKERRAEKLLDK